MRILSLPTKIIYPRQTFPVKFAESCQTYTTIASCCILLCTVIYVLCRWCSCTKKRALNNVNQSRSHGQSTVRYRYNRKNSVTWSPGEIQSFCEKKTYRYFTCHFGTFFLSTFTIWNNLPVKCHCHHTRTLEND